MKKPNRRDIAAAAVSTDMIKFRKFALFAREKNRQPR
jgi:hypothetical protein